MAADSIRTGGTLHPGASRLLRIALVLLACVLAACGGDEHDKAGSDPGNPPPGPIVGAPAPGPIIEAPAPTSVRCGAADLSKLETAIYVSPQGADGSICGQTTAAACKTVQTGIDRCSDAGCGVLIRHGLFPVQAPITLRDGVDVYGSCLFDGETDRKYRTTILADPSFGAPAVRASAIGSPTSVQGLVVIGGDETSNGAASIAISVSNSKGLALDRNVLVAGRGGDGTGAGASGRGDTGGNGSAPACATCRGASGNACPTNPPPTGTGAGGAGAAQNQVYSSVCVGNCYCRTSNSDSSGLPGQNSGSAIGGHGAGSGSSGCSCNERPTYFGTVNPSDGPPGGPADIGACSAQGGTPSPALWGSATAPGTTWIPGAGGTGAIGEPGAGGGGGGSGGFATDGGSPDLSGYPGGGGGGGGCGGPGGAGGQQGGASIALLLTDSTAGDVATSNSLIGGSGGGGGQGGQGGPGGFGGDGGPGFLGFQYSYLVVAVCAASRAPGYGGSGGKGGQGGAGSGGAGGNGGPSIGIALRGSSSAPTSTTGIHPGKPGPGGGGGSAGINPNCVAGLGSTGLGGGFAPYVNLDNPAPSVLSAGQSLRQGESRTSANGVNELILQTDGNFCLYKSGVYQWCSIQAQMGTATEVVMQTDGNLCLRNGGTPSCTNTAGRPGAYLFLRDDGHVAVQDGASTVWTIP